MYSTTNRILIDKIASIFSICIDEYQMSADEAVSYLLHGKYLKFFLDKDVLFLTSFTDLEIAKLIYHDIFAKEPQDTSIVECQENRDASGSFWAGMEIAFLYLCYNVHPQQIFDIIKPSDFFDMYHPFHTVSDDLFAKHIMELINIRKA